MMDNGIKIKEREKEHLYGKMEQFMKVNGKMMRETIKVK